MTYPSMAVRIFIASPSDVTEERDAIELALSRWNGTHGSRRKVSLVPVRYEEHGVATYGDEPQAILNEQLVEKADILIAIFWSTLGQPTPSGLTGTQEEIKLAHENEIPIHPYFSNKPVPPALSARAAEVQEYRENIKALRGDFTTTESLCAKVIEAINSDLNHLIDEQLPEDEADESVASETPSSDPIVVPKLEQTVKFNSKGKPSKKTRRWLSFENQGYSDVQDLVVTLGEHSRVFLLNDLPKSISIHRGEVYEVPYQVAMGATRNVGVNFKWTDENGSHERKSQVNLY